MILCKTFVYDQWEVEKVFEALREAKTYAQAWTTENGGCVMLLVEERDYGEWSPDIPVVMALNGTLYVEEGAQ